MLFSWNVWIVPCGSKYENVYNAICHWTGFDRIKLKWIVEKGRSTCRNSVKSNPDICSLCNNFYQILFPVSQFHSQLGYWLNRLEVVYLLPFYLEVGHGATFHILSISLFIAIPSMKSGINKWMDYVWEILFYLYRHQISSAGMFLFRRI
jgi:hypothetical protein